MLRGSLHNRSDTDGLCTECGEPFPCPTGLAIYNSVVHASEPWQCLQCAKLHPQSDPHVEVICADCQMWGFGHPDGFRLCEDCIGERLAEADDADEAIAAFPRVS